MVDARLADGSRVNAIIPPLAVDGPLVSIRKFAATPIHMGRLVELGSITSEMAAVLKAVVIARRNVLISGGTGSGKTTLLNALSAFIDNKERIITIEDSAELQLQQRHVVRLETRPANIEGKGEISQRDLVKNALRMRPDRIIVGEVRAGEAFDMLQAMNTGHDGSMTTAHANTPRDTLSRLETMCLMAGMDLPMKAIREQLAAAVDLIVQQERLKDGSRRITNITEVQGMEGDVIVLQDIFTFQQTGIENGKIVGRMKPTGIRPKFMSRFEVANIYLPPNIFGSGVSF
jgi:pilus assembly protein CpaF